MIYLFQLFIASSYQQLLDLINSCICKNNVKEWQATQSKMCTVWKQGRTFNTKQNVYSIIWPFSFEIRIRRAPKLNLGLGLGWKLFSTIYFLCSVIWGSCLFCWYWWNCWPSLFKLSFSNSSVVMKGPLWLWLYGS
jgi:hypothetical protein